ncbi:hypothetical protein FHS25_006667 [Rhizobium laguerreae]|uniref:Uncharacterized protein n=1 Tax=Rhizobium laguerreae TaxID=1076926 RepID=A0ABR6GIU7_9HYPH|nr:hypothetical protein [Rhizobium laguerreae]
MRAASWRASFSKEKGFDERLPPLGKLSWDLARRRRPAWLSWSLVIPISCSSLAWLPLKCDLFSGDLLQALFLK